MQSTLAIYEALLQANVPAPAARRVAEALESDMTTALATKQDLLALEQRLIGRVDVMGEQSSGQFKALEERFTGHAKALDERLTGKINSLDERVTGQIKALDERLTGQIKALDERLTGQMKTLESRLFIKLGGLMATLITLAGVGVTMLR